MTRFRAAAVVTLLAVCVSTYGWTTCIGWQAKASMRAACCKAAAHACAGSAADDCCKNGEQRRQSSSSDKVAVAIVPPTPIANSLVPPLQATRVIERHASNLPPHVATHLLLSVFLV
ncbi:MAG TPA: hypothetical protein VEK56_13020 [Vicinamibacterales bacterium]|nr:hypothetical protein [Vicinamibacterales bacterium]